MQDEEPSARVSEARACRICGYNLYSLPSSGRCPECGVPIFRALGRPGPGRYGTTALRGLLAGTVGLILSTGVAGAAFVGSLPLAAVADVRLELTAAVGFGAIVLGQALLGISLGTYAWFAVRDRQERVSEATMAAFFIGLLGHATAAAVAVLSFSGWLLGPWWMGVFAVAGLAGIVRHGPIRWMVSSALNDRHRLETPVDEFVEGSFFGSLLLAGLLSFTRLEVGADTFGCITLIMVPLWLVRSLISTIHSLWLLPIFLRARREAEVADEQRSAA
jgi:hypothetical protein